MGVSVTMRDIAQRLGVSVVTVSKALGGKEGVGGPLREEIIRTAREMGYRMRPAARQLKQGVTESVGVLVPESFEKGPDSFYWNMHSQLSLQLARLGYSSTLEVVSPQMEAALALPQIVQAGKVDGLVILGQMPDSYLDFLGSQDIPLVLLDFYSANESYLSVTTNNFHSSFVSTSYVIAQGHRDIGFLGNIRQSTSSIQDRYLGYCKAMLEHDLPISPRWVIDDRSDRGRLLDTLVLPGELPTAFVCNCDESAFRLFGALEEQGLSVPEDVSLVGFDNTVFSRVTRPQITTVEVDVEALTRRAAESMVRCIGERPAWGESIIIPGRLICRESVKRIL